MSQPHFIIKNKFQKGGALYENLLTPAILSDICLRVIGRSDYTVEFDNSGYNIGRLAILEYRNSKNFISISETDIRSRNSSFQSLPSALSRYLLDNSANKKIFFYFHPSIRGNYETPYFDFMYRLMKTANIKLLNEDDFLEHPVLPFTTAVDIINSKEQIRSRNRGNRSTFITRGMENELQIFGKTNGANKYETTILCLAISEVADTKVQLFQIGGGGLTELPQTSKEAIESLGVVTIFTSNKRIEKKEFEENDSLRSAQYIYNLLSKLGDKKCALCGCEIPQIIQGAHVWPVTEIKKANNLSKDQKVACALDGENGLWLCQNHHKLFDVNLLRISSNGKVMSKSNLGSLGFLFLKEITKNTQLPQSILSNKFSSYLEKRNLTLNETLYGAIR